MKLLLGRMATVLIAASMILGLTTTVTAEGVHFEEVTVNLGPQQIQAELTGHRIVGDDAVELRVIIDQQFGDGNGDVIQDEVDTFLADWKEDLNTQLRFGGAFFFEPFKINNRAALNHEVTRIHLTDTVLGPVDSEETIVQTIDALLTFPSTERTRVDYSFEEDFRVPFTQVDMGWSHAVFTPTDPWAIDPATITPGGRDNEFFDGAAFQVPYDETGNFSSQGQPLSFQLVDTTEEKIESEKGSSPAPASIVLVALTALGVWVVRRRARV